MTRLLRAAALAGLLAALPFAPASAQLNTSFGVAGGIALPYEQLKANFDAGYNVAAHISLGAPLMPIGLRLEGGYSSFNLSGSNANGSVGILSGTANATVALGSLGASPYLIGGVGMYQRRLRPAGVTSDLTAAGFNGGGGIRFPLGTMSTFIEARYHAMLGNENEGTNLRFAPITFGINF